MRCVALFCFGHQYAPAARADSYSHELFASFCYEDGLGTETVC